MRLEFRCVHCHRGNLGLLIPAMHGHATALALTVVVVLASLQWIGIRVGSTFQQISTLLKALAFSGFSVGFASSPSRCRDSQPTATCHLGMALFTAVILSLQAVIFTYGRMAGVIYFSEESTAPDKDIPRSIFRGLVSIIIIYVLLNASPHLYIADFANRRRQARACDSRKAHLGRARHTVIKSS